MKNIEDLNVDDEVLSVIVPDLPDEDLGYNVWKTFTSTGDMTSLEASSATVEKIFYDYMDGYYSINSGVLKVTAEHDLFVYFDGMWRWLIAKELQKGMMLFDFLGESHKIDTIEYVRGEVEVINFDV